MRILCVFGQHNYGDPKRGEGYEYTNFVPTFRRLGHEVIFFESWNRACYGDFAELNRALLRRVEEVRPDVIFSVMFTFEVWLETWRILRDSGIPATINWTTDDSWKYEQSSRFLAPAFHAFTTTYASAYERYLRDGIPHVLLTQWGANGAALQPPVPASECRYPVSFVGTAHGRRKAWVDRLRRCGIEVKCFGQGWEQGPVSADEIPRIIRNSAISLNFANSASLLDRFAPHRSNQIKARTFEVPGAGGFLLSEWSQGLDQYYVPGREIATFANFSELAEKIRYYLDQPSERDAMAMAGYRRTVAEHTYDRRLSEAVNFALQKRDEYFSARGIRPTKQIDWSRFQSAERQYTLHAPWKWLKRGLIAVGSLAFGTERGPRAARRLVYELSWRLAGMQTYSAAGLPGRMFYAVS